MSISSEGKSATRPALVGWIVDVQADFMDPGGRLYVRDLCVGRENVYTRSGSGRGGRTPNWLIQVTTSARRVSERWMARAIS